MGQKFALENLCRGFSLELGFPWWTLIIMKQEYAVEKKAIKKKIGKKQSLLNNKPDIRKISLQNLLAGGTPMFIVIKRAQNSVKIGTIFILPFDRIMERDLVIS